MVKTMVRLLSVAAVGVLLATMAHAEWKFSGYTQARYNFWDSELSDKPDAFDLRRVRIKAEGPVSDTTSIKLQFDLSKLDEEGAGDIELKDALITHKLSPEWKGTLGFTSVPFGYEVPVSSSKRLALERSQAANVLFPGERDTGLYFHYENPEESKLQASLGYSNGLSKWYSADKSGNEDTDSDALIARVQTVLPNNGVAGVSYMMATRTRSFADSKDTLTKFDSEDVFGAHVRYNFPKAWALQAEYYSGTVLDLDVDGWYAMAEYALDKHPATLFYRFDTFDNGKDPSDYERNTFGVSYDLDKNQRCTLQAEDYDDGKGGSFNNFAVQWQVKY